MASHIYHFVTTWHATASPAEVFAILDDPLTLPRWWPAVYLDVQVQRCQVSPLGGKYYSLFTKGWLPYTLRWRFYRDINEPPHRLGLQASGDFVGFGVWTLEPLGSTVRITFEWSIHADKPLLRYFSFVLKPVFALNHRWAMARGEESLHLELLRRRAPTPEARAAIPAPPGPTTTSSLPLLAGAIVLLASVAAAVYLLVS